MMVKKCDIHEVCDYQCDKCGHNPEENERRKKMIADNGLTVGQDGLGRLILPKKE